MRAAWRQRTDRHRVVVLALEGVMAYDLGTPTQIFGLAAAADGNRLYDVRVTTPDGDPVRSSAGFSVQPDCGPEVVDTADTLIIPGISRELVRVGWSIDHEVADVLHRFAARGSRLVSICTGAFVLAAAGLLDGRPATTHWWHAERFRRWFPDVRLDPGVLFVDDGDILTSAGVGAGVDLCLHLVRRDHGSEVANRTARLCVVPSWRDGGQAQFIEYPLPESVDASTEPTRQWLLHRLDERIDLPAMAANAAMSVRTFTRRFRAETGMSPGDWLLRQRIDRARHLLESTDLPVDRIARVAGFGSGASLRQHLRTALGVAPLTYRRTFRSL